MEIQLPDSTLRLSDKISYLIRQYQAVIPPRKPIPPQSNDPEAFIEYAELLRQHRKLHAEWIDTGRTAIQVRNGKIDSICENLIKEESGFTALAVSDKQKERIWRKAYAQGHSNGYYEVYQELCELVELFEN